MKHLKYLFLAAALILLTTTNTTADCITPVEGLLINQSETLCNGTYTFNVSTKTTRVIYIKSGATLIGNNTHINSSTVSKGIGVSFEDSTNSAVYNLSISSFYENIYLSNSTNITIYNITAFQVNTTNVTYGLYADENVSELLIENSLFANHTYAGISFLGQDHFEYNNTRIINTIFSMIEPISTHSTTKPHRGIDIRNTNNLLIQGGSFTFFDRGILLTETQNITIENAIFNNMTEDSDKYDMAIHLFNRTNNVSINNITINDAGTTAILMQKNISNVWISNTTINITSRDTLYNTRDQYEIPCGIISSYEYKGYLTDRTEATTNKATVSLYGNRNINITNISFGTGVNCYIRTQNTSDLYANLSNYSMVIQQLRNDVFQSDTYYLKKNIEFNSSSTLDSYSESTVSPRKGHNNVYSVEFNLNKTQNHYRNVNTSGTFNVSLYYPFNPLLNKSCIIDSTSINASLEPNSSWYSSVNHSLRTSGIVQVLVLTDSVSSVKINISNQSQNPDANITWGGRTINTFYTLRENGVVVANIKSDSFGNLTYNITSIEGEKEYELNITSPSVDTCVSNQTVVLQGQNITFFSTITEGGLSISKAWFNLSSVSEINSLYSSVYDYYWVTYNTSALLGTYTLNCWVNDTDNTRINKTYSSFSVVTTTTTTTTNPSTPTTVAEITTGWAGCSNVFGLCQAGDYFHCLLCPYVIALGGHVEWLAAIILFLTCVLVYMKTTTIAAPSIVSLAFGGVYMVYLPQEVQLVAGLGIGFGLVGLLMSIFLPRND